MIFVSIIIFLIALAILVIVHEFGHFIIAKRSGMQVDEFGIGFPPRIWGIKKGETIYSINALPLGGFVRIVGENNDEAENPRSFVNKKFWPRFATLIAGVVMNVILAWILVSIGLAIGLPTEVQVGDQIPAHARISTPMVAILDVEQNSPADKAGLATGDTIVSVDGNHITDITVLTDYIKTHAGNPLSFVIAEGKSEQTKVVTPRTNPGPNEGALGVSLASVGNLYYPWYYAPIAGISATGVMIENTVIGFYELITGKVSLSNVGGPIRIAALTNQAVHLGFQYVIQLVAELSVNLAIINIIPFPALDGGRILFLIIEKIRGKRNNQAIEGYANVIGFSILLLLILVISVRDVSFLIKK